MRTILALVIVVVSLTCGGEASADSPTDAFERRLAAFIDQLRVDPLAPPGFVVVAVHEEEMVFGRAYGTRDLASGAPMTLDTPIYNASVTKAYTGLLASILDTQGVLRLDETLSDVWPGLALPTPLDPAAITVRRLLSHTSGMNNGGLQYRSVWTGDVSAAMTPEHLSRYATALPTAEFRYSNLGPFVYSAMVEARTGEPWAEALRRRVLVPMGLSRTMTRLEDLPASEVAHCNTRGPAGDWRAVAHKPTATMNAAGGMYASGRDTARFVQAFLTDGASVGGAIDAATLRRTWAPATARSQELLGMARDGYGLGWDLGEMGGHRFVSRSGGFSGCRSFIMMFPDLDFGVVVLSASDAGGNMFNAVILRQALDYWTGANDRSTEAIEAFSSSARAEAAEFTEGWAAVAALQLRPADDGLARAVVGRYRNERLGDAVIERVGSSLVVQLGVLQAIVQRDLDGDLHISSPDEPATQGFSVTRDTAGSVTGFQWDDDAFVRIAN